MMLRISLLFLGTTGAGPAYSLEMAKALTESGRCQLQILISENVTNMALWKSAFTSNPHVEFYIIQTYKHTKLSVLRTLFFDKKKKKALIEQIKSFNADVLYTPFTFMWANYVYKRLHKYMRIVITLHDPHPHESFFSSFRWFAFRMIAETGYEKYVDDIIILNKKDIEYVKQITGKKVVVIPHASFNYYVKRSSNNSVIQNCIGFLGRIEPYKGLDLLIDAFEKSDMANLKLLIAGSGQIDLSVKDRIENNPRIELINRYIEDDEFQSLFDKIDFVVLPYKRASQSGVIPMAFAFGKTVIATNVGALEEQVPNGTGVIVAPDSDSIAEAINDLYSIPEKIIELGNSARNYAQTELTWSHSAKLLLDYLEQNQKACN